jgi:hypothetical protein
MTIREAVQAMTKEGMVNGACRVAKVSAVSGSTCTVVTLDTDTELTDVRLQTEASNGMLMKPTVDSFVIVAPYSDFEYAVVMFSAIDEIKLLDGSYGGLTKTMELKTQLDKTNEVLQAVVDSLKNWTPVPNDGGAALKTFFNTTLGASVVGDFSNIENEKITHGDI